MVINHPHGQMLINTKIIGEVFLLNYEAIKNTKIPMRIIMIGDSTYRVLNKEWGMTKFDTGQAYLLSDINPYVYIYRGYVDKFKYTNNTPGLYTTTVNDHDVVFAVRPQNSEDKKLYSKNRIVELTPNSILEHFTNDISDVPDAVMTYGDIFMPPVNYDDDMLLHLLKHGWRLKSIPFNAISGSFKNTGSKNNAKRMYTDGTTMKVDTGIEHCNMLDMDLTIILTDKPNSQTPMNKDGVKRGYVVSTSTTFKPSDQDVVYEYLTGGD